jgi:hypothetical protein
MKRPGLRTCALLLAALSTASASEGTRLRPIQALYADDKGAGMRQPQGVACDGTSLLAVADTGNHRLLRYTFEGDRIQPAGEIRLNEIPYPIKVQVGPKGFCLSAYNPGASKAISPTASRVYLSGRQDLEPGVGTC